MKFKNINKFLFASILMSGMGRAEDLPEAEVLDSTPMNDVLTPSQMKAKKLIKGPEAVLNFEGDMIEGEKRRPDLFLQTNVEELNLDSILYLRKDFNDFHAVDHKRRPRHFRFKVKK
jgi:hypothetical protein